MATKKKFNKYDIGQRVYFYKEDTKEYGYGYISCIVGVSEVKNRFTFKYIINDFIGKIKKDIILEEKEIYSSEKLLKIKLNEEINYKLDSSTYKTYIEWKKTYGKKEEN